MSKENRRVVGHYQGDEFEITIERVSYTTRNPMPWFNVKFSSYSGNSGHSSEIVLPCWEPQQLKEIAKAFTKSSTVKTKRK